MNPGLSSLIKKGFLDTALQLLATTGVRMALVLALFLIRPYVSRNDIATYDLFIVASSILTIVLMPGLDSALALVAGSESEEHERLLWAALGTSLIIALTLYLPYRFMASRFSYLIDSSISNYAYVYSAATACMTIVFSYFRWLTKAFIASTIIVCSNAIGFIAATVGFFNHRTIGSFVQGLLVGSIIGVIGTFIYLLSALGNPVGMGSYFDYRHYATKLMRIGWPFGIASLALIARRAVDRAIIVGFGLAALLGPYAVLSRAGEIAAFAFAIPAMGFAPIILHNWQHENGKRTARYLYHGFLIVALAVVGLAAIATMTKVINQFPADVQNASTVFLAILVGNIFFTETTVAGFGFVIVGRTWTVASLSALFLVVFIGVAIPLAMHGYALSAIAAAFLIASLIHSSTFVYLSERQVRFGYAMRAILTTKTILSALILTLLLR